MKKLFVAWIMILLTGCASYDRSIMTELQPVPNSGGNKFVFIVKADRMYQENDAGSEEIRMNWLAKSIKDNHYCQSGYIVTRRQAVKKTSVLYTIYYEVVCN